VTNILVTGAAGFIGYHVSRALLDKGISVVGVDNLNAYYSSALKRDRLAILASHGNWEFIQGDVADEEVRQAAFAKTASGPVVHLAAQAGVRWSLSNPEAYIQSNLVGFGAVLEAARQAGSSKLVYASSSSVYGGEATVPFSINSPTDRPLSLYAATKKANELMAYSYSHLFQLPTIGLRFFTVYGPWGRPDMAYWKFTEALLKGEPITVFGDGSMKRDFTYVDDVVDVILRILLEGTAGGAPGGAASSSCNCAWRVYNVGNDTPVSVADMIRTLEELCGVRAKIVHASPSAADVPATWADITELRQDYGYSPAIRLNEGLRRFVGWYRDWSRA
jgi:UDP-glucuronate 4-epimerase